MPRATASASLNFGMVSIPVKIAKASSGSGAPSPDNLCECGGSLGYTSDPVECKCCSNRYSWWNSSDIKKGFDIDGETVFLNKEEVKEAKNKTPVKTGNIEKVTDVKKVLLEFNIEGNYFLTPKGDFEEQYGALVQVLEDKDLAMLTYFEMRSKCKRYAIISEDGVLMALELKDKKPLGEDLDYDVDEAMASQAEMMIETMYDEDASLENVQGQGMQELYDEKRSEIDEDEVSEDEIMAEL